MIVEVSSNSSTIDGKSSSIYSTNGFRPIEISAIVADARTFKDFKNKLGLSALVTKVAKLLSRVNTNITEASLILVFLTLEGPKNSFLALTPTLTGEVLVDEAITSSTLFRMDSS